MPSTTPSSALSYLAVLTTLSLSPAFASAQNVIEGRYCGTAWSGGSLVEVVTTLTTQAGGLLAGSYEFADDGDITQGSLREYLNQADDTRTLIWVDKYGTGQLVVHFDESRDSFTGKWGVYIDTPLFQWDGERCDMQVVSR